VQQLLRNLEVAVLLSRLDLDVDKAALAAADGLVHHDARVAHAETLALGARRQHERRAGRHVAKRNRAHVARNSVHHVDHSHDAVLLPAGRIQVQL
jgi:hypothetical protein